MASINSNMVQSVEEPRGSLTNQTRFLVPPALVSEKLKQLYSAMLMQHIALAHYSRTRADEVATNSSESESILAGAIVDLRADDILVLPQISSAAALVKGVPLGTFVKAPACSASLQAALNDVNAFIIPESVETICNAAMRFASEIKFPTPSRIVLALLPNDSGEHDKYFSEAAANRLPVIFVAQRAAAEVGSPSTYVLPVITVDADDVIAVHRVTQEATRRARQGHGPALIRCADCGGAAGTRKDPIAFLEAYMHKKGVWSEDWKRDLEQQLRDEVTRSAVPL